MPMFPSALFGAVSMLAGLVSILQIAVGIALLQTPAQDFALRLIVGGGSIGAAVVLAIYCTLYPERLRGMIDVLLRKN